MNPPAPQPTSSNGEAKLSAAIGLVLGLLCLAGGLWVRRIEAHQQATLQETQGTVVDSVSRRERDSDRNQDRITYAPVIEFWVDDQPIRFTGKYDSYRLSNGNSAIVRYRPDQPQTTARTVDPLEGLTAWAMFGMGGLAILFSLPPFLPFRFSQLMPPRRS